MFYGRFLPYFRVHAATHPKENNALEQTNQRLKTSITNFVLADAQSFHVVEYPKFKQLLEAAIDLESNLASRN
jgi:hypothetical protein